MYFPNHDTWIDKKEDYVKKLNNIWYVKLESMAKSIKMKKNSAEKSWRQDALLPLIESVTVTMVTTINNSNF